MSPSTTHDTRRPLQALNAARIVAVSTLLLSAFVIEILFTPERPLDPLYALAAAVYGMVLVYLVLERFLRSETLIASAQVVGDVVIAAGFVAATGGALSPISFVFVAPVMVGAAFFGLRGGVLTALGAWSVYAVMLAMQAWRWAPESFPREDALYGVSSHLIGFIALGALGGILADRLRAASRELDRREGDLASLRALHEAIVESINTGILTTDSSGRIAFVNRAGREILGVEQENLHGASVIEFFGFLPTFLEDAQRDGRTGPKARFEQEWVRPLDDERRVLGFALSKLRDREEATQGWLLVFQDLTEIVSLEEQVRLRERMAALGEMAAGIAHELRNPLAAISGCVQVLDKTGEAERAGLVEVTRRETERLNRIIKDFLEFARPGRFQPRSCDLVPLMDELVRLLRKSPEFGDAHQVEVATGPASVMAIADPDRIRQVFWNLAGNAIKAMPEGGRLTIAVDNFGGDQVMVGFRDDGMGMDEQAVRRYFQPFSGSFRGGAGLGAAIVYRIAREHGGDVQVVSRPGRGTEIRLVLPRADVTGPVDEVENRNVARLVPGASDGSEGCR
jgi:two-component system sensor histidine kinase PilS (NtrC family)